MKARYVLSLFLAAAAAAGGWYWWQGRQAGEDKIQYLTETVTRGTIRRTVNATGEVDAVQLVTVGSQASGKIIELNAVIGQKVRKGDLIAQIDPTTRTNDLKTAKAQLATFNAQLESRRVALRVAQTKYNRELQLRRTDSTSRENMEDAENALASAKASVREMESQILQQEIAVNTAETNLGYTRISAPLDGTIISVPVKQGQTVNANQTTPTIVQIADLSDMEIKIEVSEGDIPLIREGQRIRYTLLSDPDKAYHASISTIDPADKTYSNATTSSSASSASSSSTSSSTSTSSAVYYYAKARVPNPDGLLRQSMTTNTVILIDKAENVLMLPSLVIQKKRGKCMVKVLANGRVEEREIETGLSNNVMTEIRSGLKDGDKVVANQMTAQELKTSIESRRGPGPRL